MHFIIQTMYVSKLQILWKKLFFHQIAHIQNPHENPIIASKRFLLHQTSKNDFFPI